MTIPFKNFLLILALISFVSILFSQNAPYDPLRPPNTFRHPNNPYYWKNKLPHEGYWQQDVYYNIKATINEKTDIIDGKLKLTYWNNSPDTLHEVFFHLYQNAFQPGSYYDNLYLNNKQVPKYGKYEAQGLGTTIDSFSSGHGIDSTILDNTILKVVLNNPILPGTSADFYLKFKTYFDTGSIRRRMKVFNAFGYKQFNGVHWYPRISVYDSKFGWTSDQHLGREFYSDFGTYDVELTFANNYIVEATGFLQNREEVLPDSLREKLDITNFKDKPLNEKPSVVIPYDSSITKTWRYHAENVHNFAFTANPIYRIGEAEWNGIKSIALVQEPHAAKWQEVAEFTSKVIEVYSTDFGMYGYHKMVVADARDGMEYPMLTLCGGLQPGNRGLIAHEVGHNWFYGMVGNNETYRAALDEGFTQFLTAWSLEAIDGKYQESNDPKNWYKKNFKEPIPIKDLRVYYGYLSDATREQDAQLNTHSDAFYGALRHGGGYRHVYYKTATMLYNLQYVLGDSLFIDAMQHYFDQWKFCHPYFIDFRNSIIHYTKVDLNWFFDQWLETTKNIDYKIKSVRRIQKNSSGYTYEITFKRKGRMQMPIDFLVTTEDGDSLTYHIPNQWFVKETEATVLDKWHGWDKLHPTYTAQITLPDKIENVVIDPSHRLADVNMMDNHKKPDVEVKFDHKLYYFPDWKKYRLNMRPALWWNAYDGVKVGFHMNGNYMRHKHNFSLTIWGNTKLGQGKPSRFVYPSEEQSNFDKFSYEFEYQTSIDRIVKDATVFINTKYLDGLEAYKIGFTKDLNKGPSFKLYMKLMTRPRPTKDNYLLYPNEWQTEKINNTLNAEFDYDYRFQKGNGSINFLLRSNSIASDFDYHYLTVEHINHVNFWRLQLRSRVFGRYGTGSNQAPESSLYFAQANNEELMENPFTRAKGFIPPDWVGFGNTTNHFHYGGGLNLRGYAGYVMPEIVDGVLDSTYRGHSGASINLELDFDGIVKWQPKWLKDVVHFDTYLFADGGFIVFDKLDGSDVVSKLRMDAGVGVAMTIKKFGPFNTKPLVLRFDMPLYLSHTPFVEPDNFQFRWVVGIHRAF